MAELSIANVSIALSGGGHRAAAFHLGVLKYLAQQSALEKIRHISSVSGGSILVAELMSADHDVKDVGWPSSQDFLSHGLPSARHKITALSLQSDFIKRMLNPLNWLKAGHRAQLMAASIHKLWMINETLQDLPSNPAWYINATSNLNGLPWTFLPGNSQHHMHDGRQHYEAADLKIADAVAASAAYPAIIGPYLIKPEGEPVYLSDGGLYDNLGLEALFDMERDELKFHTSNGLLIVSDAGSALKAKKLPSTLRPFSRLRRMINIIGQQVRALRLRSLIPLLKSQPDNIVYLPIGLSWAHLQQTLQLAGYPIPDRLSQHHFLSPAEVRQAENTATTLASLAARDVDLLIRHGYESALIMFNLSPDQRRDLHISA